MPLSPYSLRISITSGPVEPDKTGNSQVLPVALSVSVTVLVGGVVMAKVLCGVKKTAGARHEAALYAGRPDHGAQRLVGAEGKGLRRYKPLLTAHNGNTAGDSAQGRRRRYCQDPGPHNVPYELPA